MQEEIDDQEDDVRSPRDSDQAFSGVKSDDSESRTTRDAEIQGRHASKPVRFTRSGRRSQSYIEPEWDNDDEDEYVSDKLEDQSDTNVTSTKSRRNTTQRSTRRTRSISKSLRDFVAPDDDDEEDNDGNADYGDTIRARRASERQMRRNNLRDLAANRSAQRRQDASLPPTPPRMRSSARIAARRVSSADPHTSEDTASSASEQEPSASGRSYSFRTRKKINYSQVAPPSEPIRDGFGRRIRRSTRTSRSYDFANEAPTSFQATRSTGKSLLPSLPYSALPRPIRNHAEMGMDKWPRSMSGKEYAAAFGEADDSSDDEPQRTLSAPTNVNTPSGLLENGPAPARAGLEAAGQDSLGRVRSHNDPLADIDPLGVDMNVDFTQVGGLEHHVQQLKEMVTLPLLYPELFQQFGVAPPRGVLFHGPPGTGKTLVARALAASCSSTGQSISFFMRKGADCLSKWVGEAERQLRLLFDEARNVQPSIIFFDEIDGLAPVRSSKQDQIHASIVSTLLALMDGMDGRGQVIVIGATNRPDSIDPALRRPGRFDREFYFPLPNKAARQSILRIHTSKWDPPLHPALQEVLADATIGYGGADLRALCTEATLNAIQRQYPQIYHTNDRLELDPSAVHVAPRDFVLALNSKSSSLTTEMVPSSARSSHTVAQPLPEHLAPLLKDAIDKAYTACRRMLPSKKTQSALEDAMWEYDPTSSLYPRIPFDTGSPGAQLQRELLQQSFEKTRIYRPRMLLYGKLGMGQMTAAASLLHRLEGYTVQTLGITTLLGDSTQSPEAALVREFQEARRHKPSILLLPELDRWPSVMPDSVRASLGALLDTLQPSDPILLLGVSHVPLWELSSEIRSWFGAMPLTRVALGPPSSEARHAFIQEIVQQAVRPPTEFTDALPKRRRILPDLPKAAPRPAREPTQVELHQQIENDTRILEHLKFRLGPVLGELRKKFKKFTRDVWEEYNLRELMEQFEYRREKGKVIIRLRYDRDKTGEQHELLSDSSSASDSHSKHAMLVQGGAHPNTDPEHSANSDGDDAGDDDGEHAGVATQWKDDIQDQNQTIPQQNIEQSSDDPNEIRASPVLDLTLGQRALNSPWANSDAVRNREPMQIIASENLMKEPSNEPQNPTISNLDSYDHDAKVVDTANTALAHEPMPTSIFSPNTNPQESHRIQNDAVNSHTASTLDQNQQSCPEHHSPASENSNEVNSERMLANATTNNTATASSDPNYVYRDFTIYTMNLDKMQKRLYYNMYLTCDAFMEDIQKIVSNAEEAHEVDTDRVFRARQMQNLATILLDQYMDTQFRLDCERMKERVLAREHAAKIQAEKRKEAEVYPRRPNGQRYSARQQGQVPDPDSLIDIGTVRIASKRARSQSFTANPSETATEVDTEHTNATPSLNQTQPSEVNDSDGAGHDFTKRVRIDSSETTTDSSAVEVNQGHESATIQSMMVSNELQMDLIAHLTHATDGFTVEQLQQFRAACFDTIFLHRTQWDRTELFNSLHILANDLANEVNHVE